MKFRFAVFGILAQICKEMLKTGFTFVGLIALTSALQCWNCDNAASNDDCLRRGSLETCANGQDACQNEVTDRNGVLLMNKQCMKSSQCHKKSKSGFIPAWWQMQCNVTTKGIRSMTCRCCCYSDECNEGPLWCRRSSKPAATWSEWTAGECSVPCGTGTAKETRECQAGAGKCDGEKVGAVQERNQECYVIDCESFEAFYVLGAVKTGYFTYFGTVMAYEQHIMENEGVAPSEYRKPGYKGEVFPEVTLPSGTVVKGKQLTKTRAFINIPYAKPPVGELRFRDPVPFGDPKQIDATKDVSIVCPQECNIPFCTGEISEDCLFLTVQVPTNYVHDPDNLLPVMIWIHAGGFIIGSSTDKMFDAESLANASNTIVVNINYRLGYLGFLTFDKEGFTGNQGIKDQRLAMKWVHDNIAAFGGDKDEVTIFGESAGAQSTELHLVSENSRPYFNRAVTQSTFNVIYPDRKESNGVTELMLDQFRKFDKCSDQESDLKCLRKLSYHDYLQINDPSQAITQSFIGQRSKAFGFGFFKLGELASPSVDGVDLKDQPSQLFKTGQWHTEKDVIIGHTSGEFNTIELLPEPLTKEMATKAVSSMFGNTLGATLMDTMAKIHPEDAKGEYGWSKLTGNMISETMFTCYARAIARSMAKTTKAKVYFYQFSQSTSATDVQTGATLGPEGKALHITELEYLFNTPYLTATAYEYKDDDAKVSKMLQDYWGSFARDAVPSSPQFATWPEYTENNGKWPHIELEVTKTADATTYYNLNDDACNFWDKTDLWEE